MPIYEAPLVSSGPVVGFGAGDIHVAAGSCPEDNGAERYLLIHALPRGGAIGSQEETGRTDGLPLGVSTKERPANVALYFSREESVDQVMEVLKRIKASFKEKEKT